MTVAIFLGLGICLIFALALWWPSSAPRCECGEPAAYLLSDGTWECEGCADWRLSGWAPKGRKW